MSFIQYLKNIIYLIEHQQMEIVSFNMISLCLCGNESLTKILRACTVYTIIKFLYQFTEVIKREEQIHNVDNNVNTLNDIIIKKLN